MLGFGAVAEQHCCLNNSLECKGRVKQEFESSAEALGPSGLVLNGPAGIVAAEELGCVKLVCFLQDSISAS